MYKLGLIETLLDWRFRLCSNYENFHCEIENLKSIFKQNDYPKNEWTCILPYLGKILLDLKKKTKANCINKLTAL